MNTKPQKRPARVERLTDSSGEKRWYSTNEVCALTGFSYRQLHHWASSGYLGNDVVGHGSGSRRAWGEDHVRRLRWMAEHMPPTISELWAQSAVALEDRDGR